MQSSRLPSPTKRSQPRLEGGTAEAASSKQKPRRPSVKEIRDGQVAPQQSRSTAAPPSSFKVPPKPSDSKPRSSSLGRPSSAGTTSSTTTPKPRAPSLDRSSTGTKSKLSLSSSSSSPAAAAASASKQPPAHVRLPSSRSRVTGQPDPPVSTRRSSTSTSDHASAGSKGGSMEASTPKRRHVRATSVQESLTAKKPASKPTFSTFQQQFTPAKKLPSSINASQPRRSSHVSSATSPQAPAALSQFSASPAADQASKAPVQNLENLRAQTHLLHLSLLHRDFHPTYQAWTLSAHDKLATRFANLQSTYASSLALARAVRQSRNLFALHRWTNGNTATLTRKLTSLAEILRLVCDLTAEDSRPQGPAAGLHGVDRVHPDGGEFAELAREFEAWMEFVQSVWEARDLQKPRLDGDDSPPWTPAAPVTPHMQRRGRRISREPLPDDKEDREAIEALAATPIPGLGDAFKASLRNIGAVVDKLVMRLSELRDPAIPLVNLPVDPGPSPFDPDDSMAAKLGDEIPTPRYLVDLAWELVSGMRDEIQIMREAEFEVDIGEKAWAEQRVRDAAREVQGAWGTPAPASNGHRGTPLAASLAGTF